LKNKGERLTLNMVVQQTNEMMHNFSGFNAKLRKIWSSGCGTQESRKVNRKKKRNCKSSHQTLPEERAFYNKHVNDAKTSAQ